MADLFGAEYSTITPPEQAASQLGSGVDPSQATLLQALAQIQHMQNQPLIPTNPISQLGVALQGYNAGYHGQTNPAIQQALAMRQQNLNNAQNNFGNQLHMATLQESIQKEQRQAQQHKTDASLKIAQGFLSSDDPSQQMVGGQIFINEMKNLGYQIPPEAAKSFGTKPLKPTDINEIAKLMLPGEDENGNPTPGMAPEKVAAVTKQPLAIVQMIASMPDTEQWRSSIGAKTTAVLRKEKFDAAKASNDFLKSQQEVLYPYLTKDILAQAEILFPGKSLAQLTEDQRRQAVLAGTNASLVRQNKHFEFTQDAKLNQPLPAAQKEKYIDPNTYRPVTGPLTQAQADAIGLPVIDDPQTRRSLPAIKQLGQTTERVRAIHNRHPDYWPPSTGNFVQDQFNLGLAKAKMAANMNIDPDLGQLKALMADIPKLATTAGASARFSNFVAELEKTAAGWDQVATKESKMAQLNQTIQRMNDAMTSLGLNPLPRLKTLPNGKEVWIPWNAKVD